MISFIISIINLFVSLLILYILLDPNISKNATSTVSSIGGPHPQQPPGQGNAAHLKYHDSLLGTQTSRKEIVASDLAADKPKPEKKDKGPKKSKPSSSRGQHVGNLDIESGASTNFLFSALPESYGRAASLKDDTNHVVFISPQLKSSGDNRGAGELKNTSSAGGSTKTEDASDFEDSYGGMRLVDAKKAVSSKAALK